MAMRMMDVLRTRGIRDKAVQRGTAHERARRMHDAIELRPHHDVRGMRVIVVDDIMTTGNTMSRAAAVLREHGAIVLAGVALASVAHDHSNVNT